MSSMCFEFTVSQENDGCSIKTFLRRHCGITARSMTLLKYGEDSGIYRGEELLKASGTVHAGDVITLRLPSETNDIVPVEGKPDILFEDKYLLVVNKPPYMPVHPTKIHQEDTLANIVSFYQQNRGESYLFRALNRLDKDTSGCVMIAKDRLTYALVKDSIEKTYAAVCEGMIKNQGTVDLPIGLEQGSKIKRAVRDDGSPAITHYQPTSSGNGHTLVLLKLETGRTHQIRCHMSAIGHPLAGDDLYGGSLKYIDRQALHCMDMSFLHPFTKTRYHLHTDIPDDFLRILSAFS